MEDEVITRGSILPIRILWKNNKNWMLNPHPNDINNLFELWIYGNKPMDHLCGTYVGSQQVEMANHINPSRELLRRDVVVMPVLVKFGDLVMYKTLGRRLTGNDYGPCKFLKKLYCLESRWLVHYGIHVKS